MTTLPRLIAVASAVPPYAIDQEDVYTELSERRAELVEDRTEVESYLTIAGQRYRLMLTHEWSDEVIDRLRTELRR